MTIRIVRILSRFYIQISAEENIWQNLFSGYACSMVVLAKRMDVSTKTASLKTFERGGGK